MHFFNECRIFVVLSQECLIFLFRYNYVQPAIKSKMLRQRSKRRQCNLNRNRKSEQCELATIFPRHLNQHEGNKHEGIRSPCDQCDCVAT